MGESLFFHKCVIEASGRVILPRAWGYRVDLNAGVVVLPHLPSPLPDYLPADIWPNTDDYEEHLDAIDSLYYSRSSRNRELLSVIYGSINYEAIDDDGGVLVRGTVRDMARLEGEIVCVELVDHLELWNAERWYDRMEMLDKSLTDLLP